MLSSETESSDNVRISGHLKRCGKLPNVEITLLKTVEKGRGGGGGDCGIQVGRRSNAGLPHDLL